MRGQAKELCAIYLPLLLQIPSVHVDQDGPHGLAQRPLTAFQRHTQPPAARAPREAGNGSAEEGAALSSILIRVRLKGENLERRNVYSFISRSLSLHLACETLCSKTGRLLLSQRSTARCPSLFAEEPKHVSPKCKTYSQEPKAQPVNIY